MTNFSGVRMLNNVSKVSKENRFFYSMLLSQQLLFCLCNIFTCLFVCVCYGLQELFVCLQEEVYASHHKQTDESLFCEEERMRHCLHYFLSSANRLSPLHIFDIFVTMPIFFMVIVETQDFCAVLIRG